MLPAPVEAQVPGGEGVAAVRRQVAGCMGGGCRRPAGFVESSMTSVRCDGAFRHLVWSLPMVGGVVFELVWMLLAGRLWL